MRRIGASAWFCDPRDEAVKRVFLLMLPVTLGLGLINLNLLVNTFFAAGIDKDLGPAAVDKAFRIYMLPQGMFSVAVAAVLFPALSRLRGARTVPASAHLSAGPAADRLPAAPGRRHHAPSSPFRSSACSTSTGTSRRLTPVVAASLAAFSLGLAFNGAMLLLNRAFFSMQKAWVPTYVAIANLTINATLDWVFSRSLGIWSIPLATSIANIFGVCLLYYELRPIAGRLDERELVRAFVRIALATAVAVAVGYGVWRGWTSCSVSSCRPVRHAGRRPRRVTIGVYGLLAKAMKIEELNIVLALLRSRRRR